MTVFSAAHQVRRRGGGRTLGDRAGRGCSPRLQLSNLSPSRRTPLAAVLRVPRVAMGRASCSAALLRALLVLLLPLLPLLRTTRALGPRISVPLGECCGAQPREGSAGGYDKGAVEVQ